MNSSGRLGNLAVSISGAVLAMPTSGGLPVFLGHSERRAGSIVRGMVSYSEYHLQVNIETYISLFVLL